jgi:hypothetical protein
MGACISQAQREEQEEQEAIELEERETTKARLEALEAEQFLVRQQLRNLNNACERLQQRMIIVNAILQP